MTERSLKVDFNGFWHTGTGQSSGTYLDAITERDRFNLPFIAGKHLKGILRHAVRRAEAWEWFSASIPDGPADSLETLLFGSSTQTELRFQTLPGILLIEDACLTETEASYLRSRPDLSTQLYQPLYSTAIGEEGSAKPKSLRGIEVCVPVTLTCTLNMAITSVDESHRNQQNTWLAMANRWEWLDACIPLIDSLGASRTRGLGEVVLTVHEQNMTGAIS